MVKAPPSVNFFCGGDFERSNWLKEDFPFKKLSAEMVVFDEAEKVGSVLSIVTFITYFHVLNYKEALEWNRTKDSTLVPHHHLETLLVCRDSCHKMNTLYLCNLCRPYVLYVAHIVYTFSEIIL